MSMDTIWISALHDIYNKGVVTKPRGRETLELRGHQIVVPMYMPVLTLKERKLGYKFMAAEAAWMLQGDNRVVNISPYSKTIANFSDDGKTFFGAYGPKIVAQLPYVVQNLRSHDTRQAVINIWRESPRITKDVPCTLSVQFMIRANVLHTFVTMRSSDIWLGVPYDVFNFTMLSAYVLLMLRDPRLELGSLYNTAASRHLYIDNMPSASGMMGSKLLQQGFDYEPLDWHEFKHEDNLVKHLWNVAAGGVVRDYNWLKEITT